MANNSIKRIHFTAFWHLSRLGFVYPFAGRSADEYHNRTIYLIIPFIGMIFVRLGTSSEPHCWGYSRNADVLTVFGNVPLESCKVCVDLFPEYKQRASEVDKVVIYREEDSEWNTQQ